MNFRIDAEGRRLVTRIAQRAREIDARVNPDIRRRSALEWEMDVTACHANGCALDLGRLVNFRDADFIHDVFGIARHLDRETGTLGDFFTPRCAVGQ